MEVVVCVEQGVGLVEMGQRLPVSLLFPEKSLRQHHLRLSIVRQIADLQRPYAVGTALRLLFHVHGRGRLYQLYAKPPAQTVALIQLQQMHHVLEASQHHCDLPVPVLARGRFARLFVIAARPAPPLPADLAARCLGRFDYVGVVASVILLGRPLDLRLRAEQW